MRKYLLRTGLFGAIMGAVSLLRSARSEETFTWRMALAWASWAISLALAIGSLIDTRRAEQGKTVALDSPISGQEPRLMKERLRRRR